MKEENNWAYFKWPQVCVSKKIDAAIGLFNCLYVCSYKSNKYRP